MAYNLSLEEAEFQEYDIIKIYDTSIIHVVLNQTYPSHSPRDRVPSIFFSCLLSWRGRLKRLLL